MRSRPRDLLVVEVEDLLVEERTVSTVTVARCAPSEQCSRMDPTRGESSTAAASRGRISAATSSGQMNSQHQAGLEVTGLLLPGVEDEEEDKEGEVAVGEVEPKGISVRWRGRRSRGSVGCVTSLVT